jgi:tetratricopeptide (TPR) repeat protein
VRVVKILLTGVGFGTAVLLVVLGLRFWSLRDAVVVVPFQGEGAAGQMFAGRLATELQLIREVYSLRRWEAMLEPAGTTADFFVTLPPVVMSNETLSVIELKSIELGPITFSPERLLFTVAYPPRAVVLDGRLNALGESAVVAVTRNGRHVFEARGNVNDPGFGKEVAHRVVTANPGWLHGDVPRHWESFVANTEGLDRYQDYLDRRREADLAKAQAAFQAAIDADPSWDTARLNLASALYTQAAFGDYQLGGVMRRAAELFGQIESREPHRITASVGKANARFHLVHRFYDYPACRGFDRAVAELADSYEALQAHRPFAVPSNGQKYAVELAAGNAQFALARVHFAHHCSRHARAVLPDEDASAMFKRAAEHFKMAEAALPRRSTALEYARVRMLSLEYAHVVPRAPGQAAAIAQEAIRRQTSMPGAGERHYSFAHGLLADNHRRAALFADATARRRHLDAAEGEYELQRQLFPRGIEHTWAELRLAELRASRGRWGEAMTLLLDALRGDVLRLAPGAADVVQGILLVPDHQLAAVVSVLETLVSVDVDHVNAIGTQLLADALSRAGQHQRAADALGRLESALQCEGTLAAVARDGGAGSASSCRYPTWSWLGSEFAVLAAVTRAKLAARGGKLDEARRAWGALAAASPSSPEHPLPWHLMELAAALPRSGGPVPPCDVVRRHWPAALAEAARLGLTAGRVCRGA